MRSSRGFDTAPDWITDERVQLLRDRPDLTSTKDIISILDELQKVRAARERHFAKTTQTKKLRWTVEALLRRLELIEPAARAYAGREAYELFSDAERKVSSILERVEAIDKAEGLPPPTDEFGGAAG